MTSPHLQPTVVAGIDRTSADEDVLSAAIGQTRAAHGRLIVVHALDRAGAARMRPSDREDYRRHVAADIRHLAEKQFAQDPPGVACEILVDWRGPATMILAAADQASMIVIGTCGATHAGALLLGTVSQDIAVHAACPVLLIPTRHRDEASGCDPGDI